MSDADKDYLSNIQANHLNPAQKKAVLSSRGRVLVLAGAGSGKTSVLAYRIAHLTKNLKVPPESIVGLTFTNKAAGEMRARVGKLIGTGVAKKIMLATFHSFCMQLLREEIHLLGYTKQFSLYDEKDIRRIVTQLTKDHLEHDGELPSLGPTIEIIKEAKSRGVTPKDLLQVQGTPTWHDEFTNNLYIQLETALRAYNAVDFDSLISLTVKLFETFPDVLEKYQNKYQFLMIDEYQDTNPLQYRLASLLSAKSNNLCVVGDDDQSIYGWRGAEIKHILDFPYDTLIKLEQNYRSTPTILNAANTVISNNKERHPKELWSTKDPGSLITIFHAPTEKEEAETVVAKIIALKEEKKLRFKDFAILYRSNILATPFESALIQAVWKKDDEWTRGIPYQVFGGLEMYERSEVKDLLAYLKVVMNPNDQASLLRIINFPRRGISDQVLDLLTQYNRSEKTTLWHVLKQVQTDSDDMQAFIQQLPTKAVKSIHAFVNLMEKTMLDFETKPMHEALRILVETIDYKTSIQEEVKSDKMRAFKWQNVEECIQTLQKYEEEPDLLGSEKPSLHHFLMTTLLDDQAKPFYAEDGREDKVNLMTFHSAKGLEFNTCFLVCLEDHILPHEKSASLQGLEEERRLLYVALTRAMQNVYVSMSRKRKRHGKESASNPSRFLFELPSNLLLTSSWKDLD